MDACSSRTPSITDDVRLCVAVKPLTPRCVCWSPAAQRIVNNDLENIPLGLISAWASLLVLHYVAPGNGSHYTYHNIAVAAFAALRLLHTIAYKKKTTYIRPLMFTAVRCRWGSVL